MTILTRDAIIEKIKKKEVSITPYDNKNIGPGSIDLTLDNKFRVFRHDQYKIKADEKTDYKALTKRIISNTLILKPDDFCLGITKEKVKLPSDICGWLSGRSRFARLGLLVHITAPFVQPGINNKQVLEIKNISPYNIVL